MLKYLVVVLVVVSVVGCAPLKYYPKGNLGTAVPYYQNISEDLKCYHCGSTAYIFKKDSKGRIICDDCHRKLTY